MTLTTTGHVDIIDSQQQEGRDWEVAAALLITFVSTFIYIYVNANFTSIMLRLNTRMDNYRTRLKGVDKYLRKNKVSRDLRRLVKRHYEHTYDHDSDQMILDQLPHALRREVLKNIYLRSMRRVPLLFGCDGALIAQIAEMLRRAVCLPGQTILSQGDVAKELYVVESGHLRATRVRVREGGAADDDDDDDDSTVGEITVPQRLRASSFRASAAEPPMVLEDVAAIANPNPIDRRSGGSDMDGSRHGVLRTALRSSPSIDSSAYVGDSLHSAASFDSAGSRPRNKAPESFSTRKVKITGPASVPSVISNDSDGMAGETVTTDLDAAGLSFGELGVVFGVRHEATVEAIVPSQCLVLQKVDFDLLVKDFPDSLDTMKRNVKDKLRSLNDEDPLLLELDQLNEDRSHKHVAALCDMFFAAHAGEVESVREALEVGGVDVNTLDYERRSCLHVAATAGQLAVVELLLQHKSAVNRKDAFGKTPLMNALLGDHQGVIKVLLQAKARLEWDEAQAASELCERTRQAKFVSVQTLLKCGASVNAADCARPTARAARLLSSYTPSPASSLRRSCSVHCTMAAVASLASLASLALSRGRSPRDAHCRGRGGCRGVPI